MGIFSGVDSSSGKNKGKAPASPWRTLPPPSSSRPPRQWISVLVHHTRRHWEHHIHLPYPDVVLPHGSQLGPERILVSVVLRPARAHAKEVRPQRQHLMPNQRLNPAYAEDSPVWEVWFPFDHEEQRRRGVCDVWPGTLPPLDVHDEDQEAEVADQ
ncbi:hypothetical protein D1007_00939 [Hordeum vulgare]|nr:hypothetical protein D1007_00939 [Hordeum vulgare]